jgi:ABC-type uncharacterized transport system substrate-binding protein
MGNTLIRSRNMQPSYTLRNELALDFKAATTTIPIVALMGIPVEAGIVASLARPEANITGLTVDVGTEQVGRRRHSRPGKFPGSHFDLKAATSTIPIVGIFRAPIEFGIVSSLAQPGGNITGVSVDVGGGWDIWAKRVQLLKEVVPQVTRLGFLETRKWRDRFSAERRDTALKNSVSLVGPPLEQPTDEQEYHRVFAALAQEGAGDS